MTAPNRVDAISRLRAATLSGDKATLEAYLDEHWYQEGASIADAPEADELLRRLGLKKGMTKFAKAMQTDLRAWKRKPEPGSNVVTMDGELFAGRPTFDVPGIPPGTQLPPGYMITSEGLIRHGKDKEQDVLLISRTVILPIGLYRDMSSGSYHVVVAWETGDGETWAQRVVSRGVVSEARRIVQLAEFGAPVDSVNASEVVRWISAVQQYCDLPTTVASSVLGWQDDGRMGFLWGSTCIGGTVHLLADDGTEQLADGFVRAGSFNGWKRAWDAIEPHAPVGLAVYAAIAPVLVGLIREAPTFTVDWSGRQQGGKTTLLQLAASVWGDPNSLISQWRGSQAGIERLLEFHRHLPTILDDTKHANPTTIVTETIYQVTGKRGKIRAKVDGMRRTAGLRTVLLSTGERAASTFTQDAGARSRCLSVEGMPFGGIEGAQQTSERVQVAVLDNHGHLGPMVVEYLIARRNLWPDLNERWAKLREAMAEKGDGVDGRGSAYLATLMLSGLVIEEAAGLPLRLSIMCEAERWAAAAAKSADRPLEALHWVWSWLSQHASSVARTVDIYDGQLFVGSELVEPKSGNLIAAWPRGEPPAVIWSALRRDMARDGYAIEDVEGEWVRRGWLEPEPADPKKRHRTYINRDCRPYTRIFTQAAIEAVGG